MFGNGSVVDASKIVVVQVCRCSTTFSLLASCHPHAFAHRSFPLAAAFDNSKMYEMVEFPLPGGSSARATEVASGVDMASAKGTVAAVGGSRGGLSPGSSPRMGDNSWREQALKTVTREGTESDIGHRSSYGR